MSSVINETLLLIKAAFEAGVNIFNGGTAVSSSNPLPVAQTDGLTVSGRIGTEQQAQAEYQQYCSQHPC